MRTYLSLLSLLLVFACTSNPASSEHTSKHDNSSSKNLIGLIDTATLQQAPYSTWFEKNYSSYTPNRNSVQALSKILNNYDIKVFMGTWCHDSKREVPRLYKVLEQSAYQVENIDLIALNYSKQTPERLEAGLNIQRTPTFIFYKDEVEVGRIVETPRESLEQDIVKIVTGQEYKHSYQD